MRKTLLHSLIAFFFLCSPALATDYCADANTVNAYYMNEASGNLDDCAADNNAMVQTGTAGTYGATGQCGNAFDFTEQNNTGFSSTDTVAVRNIRTLSVGLWTGFDSNGNAGASFIGGGWMVGKFDGADGWAIGSVNDAEPSEIDFAYQWTGGKGRWNTNTDPLVADGSQQHVAVTYNAGATTNDPIFYYNGVSQTLAELNTPSTAADDDTGGEPTIGISGDGSGTGTINEYDGRIDEVYIRNTIDSSTVINDIMDNGLTPVAGGDVYSGRGVGRGIGRGIGR